ncbi:hypothetical protein ACTOB_005509 [Actinoplanes oblitus]|uniref:DUF3618 domain-containing protein n=1 Tax=Actinoplanes oblitus TaxID=3040509 RepID=A0ABY8W6R6_9ACTN|nr:hypothetical protein [Actinoplanes oblitus]WIM93529.1 hypothetical protein ACTOB_005509 [Actinoplanes oblitus]
MSQIPTGAYAPDDSSGDKSAQAKHVAVEGKQAAGQAVSEVKDTAAEQVRRVGHEAGAQARNVAGELRDKLSEQARAQNDRLVGTIRETADHLDEMRGDRSGSPAATVVSRVADGGRQLADYLDHHGPEGVLAEVQDFARRRPGAFLATALAAGFVVGRLGKSVAKADSGPASGIDRKPLSDSYSTATPAVPPAGDYATTTGAGADYAPTGNEYASTGTGYTPTGTDYPATGTEYASTGTGTPVVLPEEYPLGTREPRP